jgi:hypothetical protein
VQLPRMRNRHMAAITNTHTCLELTVLACQCPPQPTSDGIGLIASGGCAAVHRVGCSHLLPRGRIRVVCCRTAAVRGETVYAGQLHPERLEPGPVAERSHRPLELQS